MPQAVLITGRGRRCRFCAAQPAASDPAPPSSKVRVGAGPLASGPAPFAPLRPADRPRLSSDGGGAVRPRRRPQSAPVQRSVLARTTGAHGELPRALIPRMRNSYVRPGTRPELVHDVAFAAVVFTILQVPPTLRRWMR